MRLRGYPFRVALLVLAMCPGSAIAQSPSPGLIATDEGGAPGYQHSLERSRFVIRGVTGRELRRVEEYGFAKVVGPDSVFATNRHNSLTIAVQTDASGKGDAKAGYMMDPNKHNEQVVDYFLAAGVPKDQIGSVHANTYRASFSVN